MVRQPWQPPYYHVLLEQAGLEKAVDLFMWEMKIGNKEKILPMIWRAGRRPRAQARDHGSAR